MPGPAPSSALGTVTPMSIFAQNNGVIALTKCANRQAGYCCCVFLLLFGILGKLSGVFLAIPNPVLGGVTTFLFASVMTSGIRVLSYLSVCVEGCAGIGFDLTPAFRSGAARNASSSPPHWHSAWATCWSQDGTLTSLRVSRTRAPVWPASCRRSRSSCRRPVGGFDSAVCTRADHGLPSQTSAPRLSG